MKMPFPKSFTLLTLLAAVMAPSLSHAEYKALLKSGEELYVSDYWVDCVDNDIIRLLTNGTMTRIPRSDIFYIAPVAAEEERVRTSIKRIIFDKRPPLAPDQAEIEPPAKPNDPEQRDPSPFQKDAEWLGQELELAKETYREILKNGELEKHQEARDRIQDLSQQLNDLRARVKADNLGEIPDWWCW